MIKKLLFFLILVIYSLLLLTSCGGPKEKSETDILNDIQGQDDFFVDYELIIEDYNIIKRQTNPDDKTDYVWVEINASNDEFTYDAAYELIYVLYNEGWQLENFNISAQSYEASDYDFITQADADMAISEAGYDEYTYEYRDTSINQVTFYYAASISEMLLRTDYAVRVNYTFYPQGGWRRTSIENDVLGYCPDLVGTWKSTEYDMDLTVNVLSLEKTGDRDYDMTFTCEFVNAAVDVGRFRNIEERHTYVQDSPITINIHLNGNIIQGETQSWYTDDFELMATDGTSHEFEFLIHVGGQGGIYSWSSYTSADGVGIGWSEWNALYLVREEN